MARVTFVDETTSGSRSDGWGLEIAEERLALRELIRRRVFEEVAEFHARGTGTFQGLVRPRDSGRVDPQAECELALAAFARGGFLVLAGDRQVEELDEEVDLRLGIEVTFLRLVPLVGG
ncbi:hypothetical protein [Streptomyces sp. NPDC002889]|uniref:hypothetical protein n=1 Tax=Streptomyces sp. NPDC002889 TaxID=3364669 RepID=UPI00369C9352